MCIRDSFIDDDSSLMITSENIEGDKDIISIDNDVINDIRVGERILIDDGKLELKVTENSKKHILAKVLRGGYILPRKGVNLPESDIKLSSITQKDIEDLKFGLKNGVDWVALSFVRSDKDILELKSLINKEGYETKIIAKIDTKKGLEKNNALAIARDMYVNEM